MDSEGLKSTLILFGGLVGILWAALLFTHKRGRQGANRFLGVLMLILGIRVIMRGSYSEPLRDYFIFLLFLSNGLAFWIGPALLFHIRSLMGAAYNRKDVVRHFGAGFIISLLCIIVFFWRATIIQLEVTPLLKISLLAFITAQLIHLIVYVLISRNEVKAFEVKLIQFYSSKDKVSLSWVKQLTNITSFFVLVVLGMNILIITGEYYSLNNNADFLYLLLIAGVILTIAIKSWQRPEIYSMDQGNEEKYKNTKLADEAKDELKTRLDQLIKEEKIHTISELKLNELAEKLDTQPYLLSQFLNTTYDKSFFHFINDLRIEEAQKRIRQGYLEKETLAGLAYEVGFNSKSTFNRAFKKKTGMTPTEFVKNG